MSITTRTVASRTAATLTLITLTAGLAAGAAEPCPDLNGDGIVNAPDLNVVLGSFGEAVECPPAPAPNCKVVRDVRDGIEDADMDPPEVQANYDAINRTVHLLGDLPMADLFTLPLQGVLEHAAVQLQDLEQCGPQTDVPALAGAIDNAINIAGDLTLLDLIASPGFALAEQREAVNQLRLHGVALPPFAQAPNQAQQLEMIALEIVNVAPTFTYADFYYLPTTALFPGEEQVIENAKVTGLFVWQAVDASSGTPFNVPNNNRCYTKCSWEPSLEQCNAQPQSFCRVPRKSNGCGMRTPSSFACP